MYDFRCENCVGCPYNIGIENSASRIAGPCGQQNCWVDIYESLNKDDNDNEEAE